MKKIVPVLFLLAACAAPAPVVDADAGLILPSPVALTDVHPEAVDAVAAQWPGVECYAPGLQVLDHDEYEWATGVCGAGRCTGCAVCESGRLTDGVIQVTAAVSLNRIVRLTNAHFADCAGVPQNAPVVEERALEALTVLDLRGF